MKEEVKNALGLFVLLLIASIAMAYSPKLRTIGSAQAALPKPAPVRAHNLMAEIGREMHGPPSNASAQLVLDDLSLLRLEASEGLYDLSDLNVTEDDLNAIATVNNRRFTD